MLLTLWKAMATHTAHTHTAQPPHTPSAGGGGPGPLIFVTLDVL